MSTTLNTLDISSWKQKGPELHKAICMTIKPLFDSAFNVTMPDSIRMSQDQYDDLMLLSKMSPMYHSEEMMYLTPYNVMEVRVNRTNRLTFKEAHALDDKTFQEWEKSVERFSDET
jgi:hypothetical protein